MRNSIQQQTQKHVRQKKKKLTDNFSKLSCDNISSSTIFDIQFLEENTENSLKPNILILFVFRKRKFLQEKTMSDTIIMITLLFCEPILEGDQAIYVIAYSSCLKISHLHSPGDVVCWILNQTNLQQVRLDVFNLSLSKQKYGKCRDWLFQFIIQPQ